MSDSTAVNIDSLSSQGRGLFEISDSVSAHSAFRRWDHDVARWLDGQFPNSGLSAEWSALSGSALVTAGGYHTDMASWSNFRRAVAERLGWIAKLGRAQYMKGPVAVNRKVPTPEGKVFLVHGRNEAVREAVARFLERIRVPVVILHEQPSKGRTILEKIIEYSDVAFAVVLLTGDDLGRLASESVSDKPRARQNVILELGYFIGRLGRERVCALYEDGVELPSDYEGVVFVRIDPAGGWRFELARELRAAGIEVDLNAVR